MKRSLLVAVLIAVGCSGLQREINITQRNFEMPIIIYPLGDESIDVTTITRNALELTGDFRNYDAFPDSVTNDGYLLEISRLGDSLFVPPQIWQITEDDGFLGGDDVALFGAADRSICLHFFGLSTDNIKKQEAISKLVSAVTKNKKVAIVDVALRRVYDAGSWQSVRTASFNTTPVNAINHIVLHSYREGEYCRIVTLGMWKFSLPELSVRNVACSDSQYFGTVINGIAQTLVENPTLLSDSSLVLDFNKIQNPDSRILLLGLGEASAGPAEVKLTRAVPDEGDNPCMQLELTFVNKDYSTPQEEQQALLRTLLGASADQAMQTDHDDELMEASARAKERLPELKKMLDAGLEPGVSIMVKAPFESDNGQGNEWMWVEITKWTGDSIEGILQNDANTISDLKIGSIVTVSQQDLFDYLLMKADGTTEGNETGKILEQRQGIH